MTVPVLGLQPLCRLYANGLLTAVRILLRILVEMAQKL